MPDRTAGVEVTRNLLTAPVGDGDAGQLAPAHADPDAEVGPVVDGALARAYGYPGWLRPDWAGPGALAACNQDGQHGQQREWRQARKPLRHCGDTSPHAQPPRGRAPFHSRRSGRINARSVAGPMEEFPGNPRIP